MARPQGYLTNRNCEAPVKTTKAEEQPASDWLCSGLDFNQTQTLSKWYPMAQVCTVLSAKKDQA